MKWVICKVANRAYGAVQIGDDMLTLKKKKPKKFLFAVSACNIDQNMKRIPNIGEKYLAFREESNPK